MINEWIVMLIGLPVHWDILLKSTISDYFYPQISQHLRLPRFSITRISWFLSSYFIYTSTRTDLRQIGDYLSE